MYDPAHLLDWKYLVPVIICELVISTASVIPYPAMVVGLPVTPVHGTDDAVVAVAALPVTLIPHVPEAHTQVRVGE